MNELIQRLVTGDHPVIVGGPSTSQEDFKQRLKDMGYVFIKFTDTQGGTDLAVQVDKTATRFQEADADQANGTVHVEGTLTLNYVPVRCVADIDFATLSGTGHLEISDESAA